MEEANELIPRLAILMERLQMQASSLRARIQELAVGDPAILRTEFAELSSRHPELRSFARSIAAAAEEIEATGAVLKDLEQGLVDFPYDAGDEVVFLCWQFGEPRILAWHPIDGGFAGRQPISGAPKSYLN
ncbi:MAG: DUF2203 domain-containing protein [Candidatus Binataceae bacterium]